MDIKNVLLEEIDKCLNMLAEKHNREMKNLEKYYNELILMKVLLIVDKNYKQKISGIDFHNNFDDENIVEKTNILLITIQDLLKKESI